LNLEQLDDRITPVVVAVNDFYEAEVGTVLNVTADRGVLINDQSLTNRGNDLVADLKSNPAYVNGTGPPGATAGIILSPDVLQFRSDGSFSFVVPDNAPSGDVTFTYQATDFIGPPQDDSKIATVTIRVRNNPTRLYAVAPDGGGSGQVRVFDSKTGLERFTVTPFEATFRGGATVATGDINDDGTDDVIVGAGNGGGPVVVIYDGVSGGEITRFFGIVDPNFRGGVNVAVGDVDGGGRPDIIVGAGEGGGPLVNVFLTEQGKSTAFFAYDQGLRGGVRVAAGRITPADLDPAIALNQFGSVPILSQGRESIITGAGPGGAPHVRAFDIIGLRRQLDFFAYDPAQRGGVYVAVGNFGRDRADIVTGAGIGDPVVNVFAGVSAALLRSFVVTPQDRPTGEVFAGGPIADTIGFFGPNGSLLPNSTVPNSLVPSSTAIANAQPAAFTGRFAEALGGVRVAIVDRDRDGRADIVTGNGPGTSPRIRIFDGQSLAEVDNIRAFDPNFLGGINVGGNSRPDTQFGPPFTA